MCVREELEDGSFYSWSHSNHCFLDGRWIAKKVRVQSLYCIERDEVVDLIARMYFAASPVRQQRKVLFRDYPRIFLQLLQIHGQSDFILQALYGPRGE